MYVQYLNPNGRKRFGKFWPQSGKMRYTNNNSQPPLTTHSRRQPWDSLIQYPSVPPVIAGFACRDMVRVCTMGNWRVANLMSTKLGPEKMLFGRMIKGYTFSRLYFCYNIPHRLAVVVTDYWFVCFPSPPRRFGEDSSNPLVLSRSKKCVSRDITCRHGDVTPPVTAHHRYFVENDGIFLNI